MSASAVGDREALFQRIKAVYEGEEYARLRPDQQRLAVLEDVVARAGDAADPGGDRPLEQRLELTTDRRHPRHEGGAGPQGQLHGIEGIIDRTVRRGLGLLSPRGGGRVLTLGQPVDLVVEQDDLHAHVAAQRVDHVVAADRQAVAVAGDEPDVEFRIGQFHPRRNRRRPAMDGVKAVGRHVIGKARGAADAGDGYNVVLHEFAHKLDEENNGTNGQPILRATGHYKEWADVLGREYREFADRVNRRKNRVMDEYGLTSPAEFFAVATESFFEKAYSMQKRLPDLYEQLKKYYAVDPASWQ